MEAPKLTDYLACPEFTGLNARDCLIWLYIAEHGEREYVTRDLASAIRSHQPNISTGLRELVHRGLLEPLSEVARGKLSAYRAILPRIPEPTN